MLRAVQSNLAVLSSCPKMDHNPGEYGPFPGTTQIPVFIRDSNDATNCCAQNKEITRCIVNILHVLKLIYRYREYVSIIIRKYLLGEKQGCDIIKW